LAYWVSDRALKRQIDQNLDQYINSINLYLSTVLEGAEKGLMTTKKLIDYENINEEEEIMLHLETIGESISNVSALYLGTNHGKFYVYDGVTNQPPEGFSHFLRPWYIGGLRNNGLVHWTEPYLDAYTGELVITASALIDTVEYKGVIGVDILNMQLSELIKNNRVENMSSLLLIDSDGTILAHENDQYLNQSIGVINEELMQFVEGEGRFKLHSTNNIAYFKKLENYNMNLIGIVDVAKIKQASLELSMRIAMIGLLFIILSYMIVSLFTKRLTAPILKLNEAMQIVRMGNYSVRCEEKTNDEVGMLIEVFNDMVHNVNEKDMEMTALYEELYASEETLKEQYDELHENRELIRKSEEQYRHIFEASKEGLWMLGKDEAVHYMAKDWYKQFDLDVENSTYNAWKALIHPDDQNTICNALNEHLNLRTPSYKAEYRVKNRHGEYIWIEALGKALFDSFGQWNKIVGSHVNITQRKNYEEQILELAYVDSLTGLRNRAFLKNHIKEQLDENKDGAMLLIDIDGFKFINDTYGHHVGDEVLKGLTRRLKQNCYECQLIARASSDEFVLLLEGITDKDRIIEGIELLIEDIERPINIHNTEIKISASIGVTRYPDDGDSFQELFKNADLAMYAAKGTAKSHYVFYREIDKEKIVRRLMIESELKNAIDNNELSTMYQPIVVLEDTTLKGFEALVRWHNPKLGFISPAEFIPIAEQTGYIREIGEFVIHEACKFQNDFKDKWDQWIGVSVNVSPLQLLQKDFASKYIEILGSYNVPVTTHTIEITESLLLETDGCVFKQLDELSDSGIKLALDDYGTGYSSLNNLIQLPLSTLKLDKSIIEDAMSSSAVFNLIIAVIQFSHTMNMQVVAEGIEESEQLDMMRKLKCDFIQGYYFSPPMRKNDALEYNQYVCSSIQSKVQ